MIDLNKQIAEIKSVIAKLEEINHSLKSESDREFIQGCGLMRATSLIRYDNEKIGLSHQPTFG